MPCEAACSSLTGSCRVAEARSPAVVLPSALLFLLATANAGARSPEDEAGYSTDSRLQEIVVTAQYRQQSLQQTPLALTALAADEVVARGMTEVLDVAGAVPNVTMTLANGSGGNSNQAFIRAIGRQDSDFAFEPRVSFYIDDVYHATVFGSVFDLLDIERIEVLRGPQGTLFGRNAVGGAVRIITIQPEGQGDGYLKATVGSFDRLDVGGAIDLGVTPETLFLRVSASHQERDGHVDRLNFPCVEPLRAGSLPVDGTGNGCRVGTLGGVDLTSARAALRWVVNDHVETTLTVDVVDDNREPAAATLVDLSPVSEFPGAPPGLSSGLDLWLATIGVPGYGLNVDQALFDALQPSANFQSYAIFGNPGLADPLREVVNTPVNTLESWSASNVLDWQLNDTIGFKSITAYREFDGETGQSVMALPITEIHYLAGHRQFSQEFRLSGTTPDANLEWTVGAFYLDSSNHFDGRVQLEGFSVFIPGPDIVVPAPIDFFADDRSTLENRSVFAHLEWHATDDLNLTVGARYSDETKGYTYFRQNVGEPPNNTERAPDTSFSEFNPRLVVDYVLTPDVLAYASFATGFTSGGFNPRPFTPEDAELSFGTETAATYEIGLKSEWLGNHLRVNAAAFFTEFDDVQLVVAGCAVGCRTNSPFYFDNVGDSEIRGFEIEFSAVAASGLLISGFVGNQESRFVRFNENAFPLEATLESPTFKSPEWNAGLSIQYDADIGTGGMLTSRVDAIYRSTAYYGAERDNPLLRQGSYTLLNAGVTWLFPEEHWSAALSVTNMTDEVYFHNKLDRRNALGYADGQIGRPREWSASVTYRF